jgi:DNA-binding CsgD family transcriptional regulator
VHKLTERQLHLGKLISEGLTYEEIARELGVSRRTAIHYTDRLRWILGVDKKRHIPRVMKELGLLD